MIFATINVDGTCAHAKVHKRITAGCIGAEAFFQFGPEWAELTKTAVFQACTDEGEITKDVLNIGNTVTIPAEVVAQPAHILRIGVYGVNADGTKAIPTIWADAGRVYSATDPSGDTTTDESLPVWAQLMNRVNELERVGPGAADIDQIISGYLAENFQAEADKIVFPDGLKTTYEIGKVKLENGMGTLVEPGGTLADFFDVFIDEKVIFPETILDGFVENSEYGGYVLNVTPAPFAISAEETYTVVWNGVPWEVTAQDASSMGEGCLLLGNGTLVGLEGNGEPFTCGWSSFGITCFAEKPGPHTVAIYQTVSAQSLPAVTAADNGKIMQVVNGVWTKVSVADSAVKTYVDEYISSALEGDY